MGRQKILDRTTTELEDIITHTSPRSATLCLYEISGLERNGALQTGSLKADSHIACSAHAVPLPCRAAKGLECVFPI